MPIHRLRVRGEGEYIFKELVKAIEKGKGFEDVRGLSFKRNKKTIKKMGIR